MSDEEKKAPRVRIVQDLTGEIVFAAFLAWAVGSCLLDKHHDRVDRRELCDDAALTGWGIGL